MRVAQAGLVHPSCPMHPHLARWAHRLAPNCITHPHWMYKRSWHLARPPAVATIRECLWRTHRQTPRLQCVNGGPDVAERRFHSLQTQHNVAAPSLLELQREKRETTQLGYLGQCRWQPPETHGPCSSPPMAKSLVYGPGLGSSWGDRASSPPRFNTYSHGSTHLGVARPAPGFFLSFGSLTIGTPISNLKPRCWDLGPRLVETQDLGLGK
jgi:hypothetical protein